ncbi:MAG: tyrosine--tRNA ligase, partial [Elusimicrobiaceae bacterium]|nr:tyrosine--tRNA ligase [Elusimicrobiaceae bacterium]
KLKVKLGVDPTSADLHLGHSVVLNMLKMFQDLGHTAVLIIGDFTASVGDPSGRDKTRPVLTPKEIKKNAETYKKQAFKILDKKKTKIEYNSKWLKPFAQEEMLNTLSNLTLSQMIERDDFKKRMKSGTPISMLEILYSLFQAQDSVAVKADIELGGTDQIFNLLMGRAVQKQNGQDSQIVITVPLLVGTDGVKKMSKTYDNFIAVNDSAKDIFGKIMSISDDIMLDYYKILTIENLEEIKKLHPMKAKKHLAMLIVERFHGTEQAEEELANFEKVFSKKQNPDDIKSFKANSEVLTSQIIFEAGMAKSKNEARRLILQNAVKLNEQKLTKDEILNFKNGDILQVGRRNFVKLVK